MIRAAVHADADAIARIYNHYVLHTVVTFEEKPISATEMAGRMEAVAAASLPWLVSEIEQEVVGYAYAGKWHARSAYRHTAECTVYLDASVTGRGIGTSLYGGLFAILRAGGIHVLVGGIALPNEASVALHEKFGMKKAGHLKAVGFKFGQWIDVGYWQIILTETEAPSTGTEGRLR